jgi:hypothetical protein
MNWDNIAPLIGVAVGWLLNEISGYSRGRASTKRALARGITLLLYLYHEGMRLERTLDKLKDASSSPAEYERIRQHSVERYLQDDANYQSALEDAIKIVSEISPLEGLELKRIKEAHFFYRKIKLSESSKAPDIYIKQLSIIEAATEINLKSLREQIHHLSLRHGLITWFRIRSNLRKVDKNVENLSSLVDKLLPLKNLDEEIRKASK